MTAGPRRRWTMLAWIFGVLLLAGLSAAAVRIRNWRHPLAYLEGVRTAREDIRNGVPRLARQGLLAVSIERESGLPVVGRHVGTESGVAWIQGINDVYRDLRKAGDLPRCDLKSRRRTPEEARAEFTRVPRLKVDLDGPALQGPDGRFRVELREDRTDRNPLHKPVCLYVLDSAHGNEFEADGVRSERLRSLAVAFADGGRTLIYGGNDRFFAIDLPYRVDLTTLEEDTLPFEWDGSN